MSCGYIISNNKSYLSKTTSATITILWVHNCSRAYNPVLPNRCSDKHLWQVSVATCSARARHVAPAGFERQHATMGMHLKRILSFITTLGSSY